MHADATHTPAHVLCSSLLRECPVCVADARCVFVLVCVCVLLCCSFGLVAIPVQLRVYLVVGALAVVVLSFLWEHSLRQIFPAAKPPSKGYMVHAKQLKGRLGSGGAATAAAAARRGRRSKKDV